MTDDEIRRQYAVLRHARAQRPSSDRPDAEVIGKALDGELSEQEREAVLDRALSAGASADLALLQAARSASIGASIDATKRHSGSGRSTRWWPLAAAAVLVVAVGVPIATRQPEGDDPTRFRAAVSAAAPQLVTPASGTALAAGQRFVWTSVPGTTSYTLELLDANGRAVTQASTKDTTMVLSSSVTAADRDRTTAWWVTATAVDGRRQRSELRLTRAK
jgi:hypothetical protein